MRTLCIACVTTAVGSGLAAWVGEGSSGQTVAGSCSHPFFDVDPVVPVGESPSSVAAGDLDGDLDLDLAEPLYVEALERYNRVLGEEHPDTVLCKHNLGILYNGLGRYLKAAELYQTILGIGRCDWGEDHPDTLSAMDSLAQQYASLGRHDEAERLYLMALEGYKRVLGEENPSTLGVMTNLAILYSSRGRYEEAERLFRQSLEAKRRVMGMQHRWTREALGGLASVYEQQGRLDEALPLRRELLEYLIASAQQPDCDAATKNEAASELLTAWHADLRDPQAALMLALDANETTRYSNPQHLNTLSLAYHLTGDTARAVEYERKAIALLAPGDSDLRASMEKSLADFQAALENPVLGRDSPAP